LTNHPDLAEVPACHKGLLCALRSQGTVCSEDSASRRTKSLPRFRFRVRWLLRKAAPTWDRLLT